MLYLFLIPMCSAHFHSHLLAAQAVGDFTRVADGQETRMPDLDVVHPKFVEVSDSSALPIFFKVCEGTEDEVGQAESD